MVLAVTACGTDSGQAQAPHRTPQPSATASSTPTASPSSSAASPTPTPTPAAIGTKPADGGCTSRRTPPGNGRIAFTANPFSGDSQKANAPGDIYTVEPDGSSPRRLTNTLDAEQPAWSPDGRRIAFVRTNWRGNYQRRLWLMNADGSGQHPVAGNLSAQFPAWSPEGSRIAVSTGHGVTVINVRTGHQRHLDWSVRHWYPPEGPVWSADGKHLLVVAVGKGPGPDDYTSTLGLFTIRSSDGQGVAKLPHAKNLLGYDWSTTNCRVLFGSGLQTRGGSCNGDLFITDDRLETTRTLLALDCQQSSPVWAPDGTRIAFQNFPGGSGRQGGVWVANSDGSDAHQIVAPAGKRYSLSEGSLRVAWQPVP